MTISASFRAAFREMLAGTVCTAAYTDPSTSFTKIVNLQLTAKKGDVDVYGNNRQKRLLPSGK